MLGLSLHSSTWLPVECSSVAELESCSSDAEKHSAVAAAFIAVLITFKSKCLMIRLSINSGHITDIPSRLYIYFLIKLFQTAFQSSERARENERGEERERERERDRKSVV